MFDEIQTGAQPDGTGKPSDDNLLAAYQQLCSSYHAIDDFRAKLLGFLPLATGTGLFLVLDKLKGGDPATLDKIKAVDPTILDKLKGIDPAIIEQLKGIDPKTASLLQAVGVFGFLITLGLFAYEIYGISKCGALIDAGKKMEVLLLNTPEDTRDGPFKSRPQNVACIINEPFASGVIYSAVLASWAFFFLAFSQWHDKNPVIPSIVFVVGFVGTLLYDLCLREWKLCPNGDVASAKVSDGLQSKGKT